MAPRKKPIEPVDITTEKALLGCILKNADVSEKAIPKLTADMFADNKHQSIFAACKKVHESGVPIDAFVINTQLMNDRTEFPGAIDYLINLMKNIIDVTNWESYVNTLVKNAKLQQIIDAGNALIQVGHTSETVDEASSRVSDIFIGVSGTETKDEGIRPISSLIMKYGAKYEKARKDKDLFKGLYTGFDNFDEVTNGLLKSAVYVLAARPGVGKTAFALNIVANIIERERKDEKKQKPEEKSVMAFFCLEMSSEDLIHRLVSICSQLPLEQIKRATVPDSDLQKFLYASEVLENSKLYLDTTAAISPGEILARCQKIKKENKEKLDLVVIDYLQLLSLSESGKSSGSITQDVTRISRAIKMLAMKLEVPVIALSQMSRKIDDPNREDKTPKLSDLRESGAIEQDADVVFFLSPGRKPKFKDGKPEPGTIKLNIEKNRHGERTGIVYYWYNQTVTFKEAPEAEQRFFDTMSGEVKGKGKGKFIKKEDSVESEEIENPDGLGY
ncbi:MAG: replicative DNA helicase [Christensenellales bacterium]|jgi:replicative DNA helicase